MAMTPKPPVQNLSAIMKVDLDSQSNTNAVDEIAECMTDARAKG